MIDFEITFQADELRKRDYEKMRLWRLRKDEPDSRNHFQKMSTTI